MFLSLSYGNMFLMFTRPNLYRKGLKAMYPKASLAFRQPKGHPTNSVFRADQRGIGGFFIWTLGPELWGHPHPHGGPQHQQCL